jgi:hypothetical protein
MYVNPKRGTVNKKTAKEIYLPSQYAEYARQARKKPFPYEAMYLSYTFFKNYSLNMVYPSIRPGTQLKVNNIRALRYLPQGQIQYKVSFEEDYRDLPIRKKKTAIRSELSTTVAQRPTSKT